MPKKTISRPLNIFLCHASSDKPRARALYQRLCADGFDAWLDEEKLLAGQNWREEIPKAVENADAVLVCLSNRSINKEGYVQKEISFALECAEEKPEGTIFIVPVRLEECKPPRQLERLHWVDYFSNEDEVGYEKLRRSLLSRAEKLGVA